MVHLTPDTLITGPKATDRWGRAIFIDLGADGTTLAVSRENRLPRASVVVTLAAQELMRLSKAGEKADHVVLIGSDVDPTHHPDFREISDNVRELRNKWFPRAKLVLISDDPKLDLPETRIALGSYDFNVMRLESGTAKTYSAMTGKKSTELGALVKQLLKTGANPNAIKDKNGLRPLHFAAACGQARGDSPIPGRDTIE